MEFIVKSNQRWNNNSYYQIMSFTYLVSVFCNGDDSEVDEMIESVANLNLNESFSIDFFGGNSYTFKRNQ
jgi:hypothetical protein